MFTENPEGELKITLKAFKIQATTGKPVNEDDFTIKMIHNKEQLVLNLGKDYTLQMTDKMEEVTF